MYYCWTIYGILIWLYWIDDCFCVGNPNEVENSKDNIKRLFDFDDVGDIEEYVGCKIDCDNMSFNFTQPFMVQSFNDEFDVPKPVPITLI